MITKKSLIENIFINYCVSKVLLKEKGTEYWVGSEADAWHIIFISGLADEYFKWEKENGQYYGL